MTCRLRTAARWAVLFAIVALLEGVYGLEHHHHHHHDDVEEEGYVCQHNTFAHQLKHVRLPHASVREMHAQAGGTWRPLRLTFNWTYADDPSLDVYPATGEALACYPNGPSSINYPPGTNWPVNCLDGTGNIIHTTNCKLLCQSDTIATAADVQTLKDTSLSLASQFGGALSVEVVGTDAITVTSDAGQSCGNLRFPPTTYAAVDMVIYATLRPLKQASGVVAFATPCDLHLTTSRPILGQMNVDPITLKTNTNLRKVLLHELTHALGFTSSMYGYYRHPADNTKTYYQYDPVAYPYGPLSGAGAYLDTRSGNPLASLNWALMGAGAKTWIVTPNVVAYSRAYFDCSTLLGAELENGGAAAASTGTHWERRILFYEYMGAVQTDSMYFSGFTLALLADMGFYRATMSAAQNMTYLKGKGCAWAQNKCMPTWSGNYLCSSVAQTGCSYDYNWVGLCNLKDPVSSTPIPADWQYFGTDQKGGDDKFGDFCPTYQHYSQPKYCNQPSAAAGGSLPNTYGALPTTASRCFKSSVIQGQYDVTNTVLAPECFPMLCNSSDVTRSSAVVRVGDGFYTCTDGLTFTLKFPPQSYRAASFNSIAATSFVSYNYIGTFQCGPDIALRCGQPSTSSLLSTADVNFPTITAVAPYQGNVLGGTEITINGTNLDRCQDVQVGGGFAVRVTRLSSSVIKATLVAVKVPLGGPNADATGSVDVALWCNVTDLCPEGCEVGRLIGGMTLSLIQPSTTDLASTIQAFLNTALGKVTGAGVAVIAALLLVCLVKALCCRGDQNQQQQQPPKPDMRVANEYGHPSIQMQHMYQQHHQAAAPRRPVFDDGL